MKVSSDRILDSFGIYFAEVGLSKTYGRLFGFFMTASAPVSMGTLVTELEISKSTASTELRRLLAMGVIEKVLLPDQRADYYQLKQDLWSENLKQKTQDIRKLRAIVEEVPGRTLQKLPHLQEMAQYCTFLEEELDRLIKKYTKRSKRKT